MDTLVETLEYRDHQIEIHLEPYPEDYNPRDDDNLGKMICFHPSYILGDEHDHEKPDSLEALAAEIETQEDSVIEYLPLYLYDHSGITMSTGNQYPFNCRWDSMICGIVYITEDQIKAEYSVKHITDNTRDKALKVLIQEIKIYDQYLTGQVYGYEIKNQDGDDLESCWGFLGDPDDYMVKDAKEQIDYMIENNT